MHLSTTLDKCFRDGSRGFGIDIDQADFCLLTRKMRDDGGTNSATATGDDDRLALKIWINRATRHRVPPVIVVGTAPRLSTPPNGPL